MNAAPLVSVVIPFFNADSFLHESIASIASQTYDYWELLLVDDGSTDESANVARSWVARHLARIRYLQHPNAANRGISASRNLGVRHASGELVAFLDADDVWLQEKLAHHVELLATHPEAGMVYGRTEYWHNWTGNRGDNDRDHVPPLGFPATMLVSPPTLLTAFLCDAAQVPCPCSIVVRRTLVEQLGGFDESFRGLYEDQVFYAKVCLNAPVVLSNECLERYRQHAGSCARASNTQTRIQSGGSDTCDGSHNTSPKPALRP